MSVAVSTARQTAQYPSRVWAEIDLNAIRHNVNTISQRLYPCQFYAVVKANGYGLGAVPISQAALSAGATGLAVATCEEGIELREAGITAPVLVLGYVPVEVAALAVAAELTLTVNSPELAITLSQSAKRLKISRKVAVHLKAETGLNRFGLTPEKLLQLAYLIRSLPQLELEGLYTHFATGDEADQTFVTAQHQKFEKVRQQLIQAGFTIARQHFSNSSTALLAVGMDGAIARVGLSTYGYYPSAISEERARAAGINLLPALTLKSRVAQVGEIEPGDSVGYNRTFIADSHRTLVMVTVGYADGFPRMLSNRGFALIQGERVPVVGRVSMDQITLDATRVKGVREGDEVILIGSDGSSRITLEEVAEMCGSISYEILTGLGRRVQRVYLNP